MKRPIDRLKEFAEHLKKTHKVQNMGEFEANCGLAKKYISNSILQNGNIRADTLSLIYNAYPFLNLTWLITGEGNMINQPSNNEPIVDNKLSDEASIHDEENNRLKSDYDALSKKYEEMATRLNDLIDLNTKLTNKLMENL